MQRRTVFIPSHGYVTGYGLPSDIFNKVISFLSSKPSQEILTKLGTTAAETAGKKLGEKVIERIFPEKPTYTLQDLQNLPEFPVTPTPPNSPSSSPTPQKKSKKLKKSKLKKIYAEGLFRI